MTKKVATISGLAFTIGFFILFEVSEKLHAKRTAKPTHELEKFRLEAPEELSSENVNVRPGNVLVPVRNPHLLDHLRKILEKTDTRKMDIVVLTVKQVTEAEVGEHGLEAGQLFTDDVAGLFSRVVSLAEKAGKHVELMVVPGFNANQAIVETAARLKSSTIVMGLSPKLTPEEQAKAFGDAWERLPHPRPQMSLELVRRDVGKSIYFNLGPHPPRLWPEDVDLVHQLWRELSERGGGHKIHHRDVVHVALQRLEEELHSSGGDSVVSRVLDASGVDESQHTGMPPG
jgi:hypothetical protein